MLDNDSRLFAQQQLLKQLRLEQLGQALFRGSSSDIGSPIVFGGQLVGQAVMAASLTVPTDKQIHSLHGYFLQPGDKQTSVIYEVSKVRDGSSFSARQVRASQDGRDLFHMSASFQRIEEGICHQIAMPTVPAPHQWYERAGHKPELEKLFEMRFESPLQGSLARPKATQNKHWFRSYAALPDDLRIHQALLAYFSDYSLLSVALLSHGLRLGQTGLKAVSLDHSIWFHRPFRCDEWLLYVVNSPSTSAGRGFCQGSIFNEDGQLVASVAQEGVVRVREKLMKRQ